MKTITFLTALVLGTAASVRGQHYGLSAGIGAAYNSVPDNYKSVNYGGAVNPSVKLAFYRMARTSWQYGIDVTLGRHSVKSDVIIIDNGMLPSSTYKFRNVFAAPAVDGGVFLNKVFSRHGRSLYFGARVGVAALTSREKEQYKTVDGEERLVRSDDPGGTALSLGMQAGYERRITRKLALGVELNGRYMHASRERRNTAGHVSFSYFYFPVLLHASLEL